MIDFKNKGYNFKGLVVKICDWSFDPKMLSNTEKLERCRMASLCRLIDLYSWSLSIQDSFSYRFSEDEILMNPSELLPYEITASSLIKTNMAEILVNNSNLNLTLNKETLHLHTLIYKNLSESSFIIQLTNPTIISVFSSQKLAEAVFKNNEILNGVGIYKTIDDNYSSNDDEELIKCLGTNKIIFVYGKELLCIGSSLEDAFNMIYKIMFCCRIYVDYYYLINVRFPNLVPHDHNICTSFTSLLQKSDSLFFSPEYFEFDAHIRVLERLGYETGLCDDYILTDNESIDLEKKVPSQLDNDDYSCYRTKELNSDSGIATVTNSEEKGLQSIEYNEFNMEATNISEAIPYSESSKELLICTSYFGHDDKEERSKTPNSYNSTKSESPTHKRFKSLTKNTEYLRRSKSLTSGVEKAIFRRINEKCMHEH